LERNNLEQKFEDEEKRLKKLLEGNGWKHEFRGKPIFSILCSRVFNCDQIRVRQAYTDIALRDKPDVFADIIAILGLFK
jgi:hypothetical protein